MTAATPTKRKSKKTGTKATKKAAPVVKAKPAKPVASKPAKIGKIAKKSPDAPLTQIDAACKWLSHQQKPKTVSEIVAGCVERGYWKSPEGKSPQRTLYTNLLREMAKTPSRVTKVGRGLFTLTV